MAKARTYIEGFGVTFHPAVEAVPATEFLEGKPAIPARVEIEESAPAHVKKLAHDRFKVPFPESEVVELVEVPEGEDAAAMAIRLDAAGHLLKLATEELDEANDRIGELEAMISTMDRELFPDSPVFDMFPEGVEIDPQEYAKRLVERIKSTIAAAVKPPEVTAPAPAAPELAPAPTPAAPPEEVKKVEEPAPSSSPVEASKTEPSPT